MKVFCSITVIALVIFLTPSLVACETSAEEYAPVAYDLTVSVDGAENTVKVDETVTVVNSFREGIDRLVFAFYPDAFTLKTPPPVDDVNISAAYPYGINAGSYAFLQAGGEDVKCVSLCETPCKIVVYLDDPLSLGESTEITFSFDLTLPLCNTRYGYNDFSVNLTFFFPVLCRYDENAANTDGGFVFYGYESTGDPFVFDCADYDLTLDCPSSWQAVCSAPETGKDGNKRIFSADALRDLSLFLAPDAEITTASKDGYTVKVLHDGSFSYAAEYAVNALSIYSEYFCPLPVKEYSLVFTPFMTAGAEFCNAAIVSDALSLSQTETTVAHEVAHQWWYSFTGSDQVRSPWQDEALAQWSTLLYFEKRGMKTYADTIRKNLSTAYKDYVATQKALGENADCNVFRSTTDYRDGTDYYITVYCKAALALDTVAQSIGTRNLCNALSGYARSYRLSYADEDGLFTCLDAAFDGAGALLKSALSSTLL